MLNLRTKKNIDRDSLYLSWKNWEGDSDFGLLGESQSASFDAELQRLGSNLPINSKVLEIGFGKGAFLRYAKSRG